jgi:heat shock protein HspQ
MFNKSINRHFNFFIKQGLIFDTSNEFNTSINKWNELKNQYDKYKKFYYIINKDFLNTLNNFDLKNIIENNFILDDLNSRSYVKNKYLQSNIFKVFIDNKIDNKINFIHLMQIAFNIGQILRELRSYEFYKLIKKNKLNKINTYINSDVICYL